MAKKFELITELYRKTLKSVTAPESWQRFLTAASYNYKLSFDEQLLVYAQRPDATAVLEIERWNRQFGRWVNRGATGIAVFDGDHNGRARLKHYFDISDTHETQHSRSVPIWTVREDFASDIIETLENSFGELEDKSDLATALLSAVKNAVQDNMADYLAELRGCTEGSFLEELDDLNVEVQFSTALENSIGYMLLSRCGCDTAPYFTGEDFLALRDFNTPATLNALGTATGDIAKMCLSEIARTVLTLQKQNRTFDKSDKFLYPIEKEAHAERSFEHDRNHIPDGERLPNLLPPQEPEISLGKYALLRRKFLKQHRRVTYTNLLTLGRLNQHLMEVEQTALSRMEQITVEMAKSLGVTEELKARDMMQWVGLMNNIRQSAEETVLNELIYS